MPEVWYSGIQCYKCCNVCMGRNGREYDKENTIGQQYVHNYACLHGINYMGKVLAADWQLPLWMDSIGTGMSACLLGPFFGALCGATNNILYGMRNVTSYAYAVTSVAIAIVMGICMRRHMIRDWFGVFTTSALVSVVAVVVSTPFNLIFFQGI